MTRSIKGDKRRRNPDYLPAHIGLSFESELDDLIVKLAQTDGARGAYLLSGYKSKYLDNKIVPSDVRATNAINKWLVAERQNEKTNCRLLLGDEDFGWVTSDAFIAFTRTLISDVLGTCNLDLSQGSFTNGASTRIRRGVEASALKHAGKAHVTKSALPHWDACIYDTILASQEVEVVPGSVLFTVPKKTDIDRVACKEPEINMFMQRCVGDHIRSKLRRRGINLNDQSINADLAKNALRTNSATIDLSSASDTITKQLVITLLPFEWYSLLDDLRSHSVEMPYGKGSHDLEMFSSMGNGFTFELESLIFWALTRSVCYFSGIKGKVSVYGDDIICPTAVAPRLARIFNYFGFTVNMKKSAWTGGFRESCGEHYLLGRNITPFYLREAVRSYRPLIRILNKLVQWDGRPFDNHLVVTNHWIARFHQKWSEQVPSRFRGGKDVESSDSLFTYDRPRSKIGYITLSVPICETLQLKRWLTQRHSTKHEVRPNVVNLQHMAFPHLRDLALKPIKPVVERDNLAVYGSKPVPNLDWVNHSYSDCTTFSLYQMM